MAGGKIPVSVSVTRSKGSKQAASNIQCARGKVVLRCVYCVLGITYQPQPQQKPQLYNLFTVIFIIIPGLLQRDVRLL